MIREWVLSAGLHNINKKNHFISELGLNHPSATQPVWPEWPVYPGLWSRNHPLVSTQSEMNIQDVTLCREVPGLLAFDTWADNNLGALARPETCWGAQCSERHLLAWKGGEEMSTTWWGMRWRRHGPSTVRNELQKSRLAFKCTTSSKVNNTHPPLPSY